MKRTSIKVPKNHGNRGHVNVHKSFEPYIRLSFQQRQGGSVMSLSLNGRQASGLGAADGDSQKYGEMRIRGLDDQLSHLA
jgi:hypothetical protein